MGLRQAFEFAIDQASVTKLERDMRAAGARGGAALDQEFERKMADIRADLADGLINERDFKAKAARVSEAFNQEIIKRMDALRASGKDTTQEYINLSKQLKSTSDVGVQSGGLLSGTWSKMKSMVIGLGASIAAAFTVRAVIDFARESVKAAAEAESAWSELGVSLENAGVDLATVRDRVAQVAAEIQNSTRFGDESVLRGLNTLVQLTGDYEKSLSAIGPIADFAAAKHLTFEQASTIVGKALAGNDMQLRKLIPTMTKGGDVIQALGRFHGAAAADMQTFAGAQAHVSNLWGEFQEEIGKALIASVEGGNVMGELAEVLKDLTTWVSENKEEIARWGSAIVRFVAGELKIFAKGVITTISSIGTAWKFMAGLFGGANSVWGPARIAFAQFIQQMLGLVLKLQEGMLSISEALGLPFSDSIRASMQRTSGYIGELGVYVARTSADMKRSLGSDDPNATKTTSIGGAVAHNVEAGADAAAGSLDTLAGKSSEAAKKAGAAWKTDFLPAFTASMDEQVAAADKAGRTITEGVNKYLAQQREAERKANSERIQGFVFTADRFAEVSDESLRMELARQQMRARDMSLSEAERRKAFEETAAIYAELEERKRQQSKATGDAGVEAAETTKTSWIEAMGVLGAALGRLGDQVGGVFGKLLNGVGGIVDGLTAAKGGFDAFRNATGTGLTGLIEKAAGLASGFGGVIGIASQLPGILKAAGSLVGGILKGLGDILGIGNTNPYVSRLYGFFTKARAGDKFAEKELERYTTASSLTPDQRKYALLVWEAYLRGAPFPTVGGTGGDPRAPAPRPPSTPTAPPPTGGDPRTPTTPTNPWNPGTPPRFQTGGWMPHTGLAHLEANELVLPPRLSRDLAAVIGGKMPGGGTMMRGGDSVTHDARSLHIAVALYGIEDREVPQRVVSAVREAMGRDYKHMAGLSGNSRIGG